MINKKEQMSMGIIMGNRGFFSDDLCKQARKNFIPVLKKAGIKPIILSENENVFGSVESRNDARKCAELFKQHQEELKGIIVTLPNFGDEKAIAETFKMSNLDVPVLVHAFPDDKNKLDYSNRRDSFCGKISVCNNLRQYGIKFTLTEAHNEAPGSELFRTDLNKFKGICRVVDKLRGARVGVIGPRPAGFNTVRYSEKILERNGISVEPLGIAKIISGVQEANNNHQIKEIKEYIETGTIAENKLEKMAGLLQQLRSWIKEEELDSVAIQCWDSLEKFLGITPCSIMSLLANNYLPASCEADVMGAVSMLALQEAAKKPSALADWNNNFGNYPDKAVLFHCGNFARDMYQNCEMKYAEILGSTLGEENTEGAIYGILKSGEITFGRLSTDDNTGKIKAYLAEGELIEADLDINGSWGVVEVPGLQDLMKYICQEGFEHHVAINLSSVSAILEEAFSNYLGWEVYNHK
ncbi:MAG: L-fucose/L-arabinose isomerase family protein [Bacillota bacterium]